MIALERRECEWIHAAGRMTAGGECAETSTAEMIQQRFRHDAAGGVTCAEKELAFVSLATDSVLNVGRPATVLEIVRELAR